ncbi:phospholipase A1 member A [Rana temporaria]|uniref:phospholipase A1 member A n=1 Tax=Rana temporaria TaxID=8407 RepID=UPI001AAC7828|nr:phospholipase A1 member A [Rana temporaria]
MSMAGRGMAVLIASLLTSITSTALAQQVEPRTLAPCGAFQTSGFFQDHKLEVQFLLYTPRNPTCAQVIHINQSGSIKSSMFNTSLDTKIIIHGFRVLGSKPSWTENLVEALLDAGEANVVVIDWVSGSTAKYNQAVENVPKLTILLVPLINRFLELGSSLESLHLIGVSLGAHVAGHVGSHFGGRIGWITGLDPAAYKYTRTHPEDRLDPGDALFVDAVHTDTDNFGIRIPVGHIDYFINGGRDQPGCPYITSSPYKYLICDHMRSVAVYINAVRGRCSFVGFPCSSYKEFQEGLCVDCETTQLSSCPRLGRRDALIIPGEFVIHDTPSESQNYTSTVSYKTQDPPKDILLFLLTTAAEPYCAHHILLEFTLSELKDISITMEVQLSSLNSSSSKTKITIPKQTLEGRGLVAHGAHLCLLHQVEIRVMGSRFWRRGPEFSGTLCMTELPMNRRKSMACLPRIISFSGNTRQTFDISEDRRFACP